MKNQYFGDVNDYLKYGLLRCFSEAGLRIGVCWMLTPDDGRSDGGKIGYLSKPERWRCYDPTLFDSLSKAVRKNNRLVRYIQNSALLPNASFFNSPVPDDQGARKRWLNRSLRTLGDADLLFFDPDNGIEIKSTSCGRRDSCKFLFWDEIQIAWAQRSALLIFQHFCREERDSFVTRLASRLRELLVDSQIVAITTSSVVYFLVFREYQDVRIGLSLQTISKKWTGKVLVRGLTRPKAQGV